MTEKNPETQINERYLSFWVWFFKGGYNATPGWKRLLSIRSTYICFIIAFFVARITKNPIEDIAASLFLPLIGIFVGLSFAWVDNMLNSLNSPAAKKMALANTESGGYRNYLFVLQNSVFVLLLTLIFWGLTGIGVFKSLEEKKGIGFHVWKTFLFFMLSISIAECWGIIQGTIWTHLICDHKEKNEQYQSQEEKCK